MVTYKGDESSINLYSTKSALELRSLNDVVAKPYNTSLLGSSPVHPVDGITLEVSTSFRVIVSYLA